MKLKSVICSIIASFLLLGSMILSLPMGIVVHAADGETVTED